MATPYYVLSLQQYGIFGIMTKDEGAPRNIGESGTDTDDGEWNLGDAVDGDSSDFVFAGTFEYNGHTILVFHHSDGVNSILGSPTATNAELPGSYEQGNFTLDTNPVTLCFAAGSLIRTPNGEKPVETLAIGDEVTTASGRNVPVKWIGRQTVSTMFTPAGRGTLVRFAAGSLGDGLPHSDLGVTADHAMLVDDILIHAGALLNGSTITQVPKSELGERFTVYHIETEEHEIILANGTPTETFIDNVSRSVFDNYDEFHALYGDVPEMEELPHPRAMSARQVPPAIKAKLAGDKAA